MNTPQSATQRRLHAIATNLWGVEHEQLLPGGMQLRGRMSVVRFTDDQLLLHSPIPIDDELARELAELGTVTQLVAPNALHHMHLSGAVQRYPAAKLYGPGALFAKRADLKFAKLSFHAPWQNALEPLPIEGAPALDEFVFFHGASRTLLVADYFFNIQRCKGWLTPWVLRLTGTYRRFAQSRIWRWSTKDRESARRSARGLLAWDFERIVPAHGEVVTSNARARAERALGWLVGDSPKALPRAL